MVTKAGVPSYKIIVGVSSYGRSFGMTDPGCTGPMCTFVGPESAATKGECTNTAGYIANAEIDKIIADGGRAYYDTNSESDILVYGSDWVAYMTDETKAKRTSQYKGLNFGGTTDWAVDLANFVPELGDGDDPPIAIPIEEDWRRINCSHSLARDVKASEIKRWDELKCKSAWESGISAWSSEGDSGLEFVPFLSDHWNGPPDMDCSTNAPANGCSGTVECISDLERSPAGALILRGFMKLNSVSISQSNILSWITARS